MERDVESALAALQAENARLRTRQQELEGRLSELEQAQRAVLSRSALADEQVTRLTRLYVASMRLHEAREPGQVLEAIQEIINHLLGSEELAILRVEEGSPRLSVVALMGIDAERLGEPRLGEGRIGRVALTGETYVSPTPLRAGEGAGDEVSACVPLMVDERVLGVIAIFGLLPQKERLEEVDHELLSLLAVQAAHALHRAEWPVRFPVAS